MNRLGSEGVFLTDSCSLPGMWRANAWLAAAYVLSGKLGLLLALPPGYASAIFPPAGIAVAAALIGGARFLPGTFIGSLLLNIWIGYSATQQFSSVGFLVAATIAVASTLQAAAGGWLLRRAIGYPAPLDQGREIRNFLFAAPAICLVSASISVTGLLAAGFVGWSDYPASWATWWAGDTIGVLVLLPLTLVIAGEPRALWRRRAAAVAAPMLLSFGLFTAIYLRVNDWERQQSLQEFRSLSEQLAGRIHSELEAQAVILEGPAGKGVPGSVSRMGEVLGRLVAPVRTQLLVRVTDAETGTALYDSFAAGGAAPEFRRAFSFGAREFRVEASPTPAYLSAHRGWQSWGVLAGGLFGTGLLGALLMLGSGQTARVESLVAERTRALADSEALFRALHQRTAQLEAANKELESFSYSVSHDLRAPLRAVSGYSQMLQEDNEAKLDDEGRRMLKVIREGCADMGKLIDALLTFSGLGRVPVAAAAVDMGQVAVEAFETLRAGGEAPGAGFELKPMPEAWGDRALLRQVWANLLANALKFSARAAQPLVEAGGEQTASELVYWCKDNGAGFDMRYYDKLFGVFQRLHRAEEFPGTGVGLATVQRIVAKHGGRVWAQGKVNGGAAFYFALPKRSADERI